MSDIVGDPVPGVTIVRDIYRVRITVPTVGARISDLIRSAEPNFSPSIMAFMILGLLPDGSDRAAITVASPRHGAEIADADFTLRGERVQAGSTYHQPSAHDIDSYIRAASSVPAIVVVYY